MRRASHLLRLFILATLAPLTVACDDNSSAEPARSYEFGLRVDDTADDYRFIATTEIDIRAGDEVTFVLDNTGTLAHNLEVMDPDGKVLGATPNIGAGATTTLTVDFAEAGYYRLNCNTDDHLVVHSMQAIIEVVDPE